MRPVIPALILLGLTASARAEGTERFRLERLPDGFVRMDTETGAMSRCTQDGAQLVCRMAADERAALEDETDRLRGELAALEARVAALEKTRVAVPLPSDADIDKTLGVVERLFRGFVGIARELESEAEEGKATPDRT